MQVFESSTHHIAIQEYQPALAGLALVQSSKGYFYGYSRYICIAHDSIVHVRAAAEVHLGSDWWSPENDDDDAIVEEMPASKSRRSGARLA